MFVTCLEHPPKEFILSMNRNMKQSSCSGSSYKLFSIPIVTVPYLDDHDFVKEKTITTYSCL